ncbi:MAG: hypothetical protein QM755_14830 [Luteolibacter sp.]
MNGSDNPNPRQPPDRKSGKLPPALVAYRTILWIVPYPVVISVTVGYVMVMAKLRLRGWDPACIFFSFGFVATCAIGYLDGRIVQSVRPLRDSLGDHVFKFLVGQTVIGLVLLFLLVSIIQRFF